MEFLILDDDDLSIFVSKTMIRSAVPDAAIRSFTEPMEALEFIAEWPSSTEGDAVLLLDLSMPVCSGWQFIDRLRALPNRTEILTRLQIIILSSSDFRRDMERAASYPEIMDYWVKPLNPEQLQQLPV